MKTLHHPFPIPAHRPKLHALHHFLSGKPSLAKVSRVNMLTVESLYRQDLRFPEPLDMGVHLRRPRSKCLPAMAHLWLAHDRTPLDMGRAWRGRDRAIRLVLHPQRVDVHTQFRARRLGSARTGPVSASSSTRGRSGCIVLRDMDLSDTHLFEFGRDFDRTVELGYDSASA